MRVNRFTTRLVPPTLAVIMATVATVLIGGVASAAVLPSTTAWQFDDATSTTITLAVTPDSSAADATTTETLTATVTPATAAGTVQFTDGNSPLGSPVTVIDGTASTTATLASGAHTLTAVFTTTDSAYSGSSSNAVDYTVNGGATGTDGASAGATITTLAVTPDSPATDATTTETLTATISPATADGTVQFTDGSAPLGSPVTVTDGTASTTATLASGQHTLIAVFITTDPAFSGSASNAVDYTVNGAATGTNGTSNGATATTTKLALTPDSPATDATTTETLTATISPATADGIVQFTDGRTLLGNAVTVSNGTASTTATLAAGKHALTALFVTTDTTYRGSISNTVDYTVNGNRNHRGIPGGNRGILGGNQGGSGGILSGILGGILGDIAGR
jgi:hypothetical protein